MGKKQLLGELFFLEHSCAHHPTVDGSEIGRQLRWLCHYLVFSFVTSTLVIFGISEPSTV